MKENSSRFEKLLVALVRAGKVKTYSGIFIN
jgi:hypothetical protein